MLNYRHSQLNALKNKKLFLFDIDGTIAVGNTLYEGSRKLLEYIDQIGINALRTHETALTERFLDGLRGIKGARLAGTWTLADRVGVIAVDFEDLDNAEASDRLEREFGILTRCGMHCAPSAHKTLGTFPQGVVRFSVGYRTTEAEIDAALAAIYQLTE